MLIFSNENNHFYCGSSGAKCNTKLKNDEIRPLCLPFPERSFESNKAAILQTWWIFVTLWRFLRHLSNTKKKLQKAALPQKLLCLPVPLSLTTDICHRSVCVEGQKQNCSWEWKVRKKIKTNSRKPFTHSRKLQMFPTPTVLRWVGGLCASEYF